MSYSPDAYAFFRRNAWYIDRVLRGATPANLPVEQPTQLRLVINLKTAKALDLTIPPSVRLRADQVIEWSDVLVASAPSGTTTLGSLLIFAERDS